ncbi:unnamed protein product, partial [Rotaria sp. Silwood2]
MLRQLNNCGDNLLNILILDACRADKDNDTWKMKAMDEEEYFTPAFGKALTSHVRIPVESQFALIFSSDPGTVSFASGSTTSGNSFFTSALLNHLSQQNLRLEDMMGQVTREILQKSRKRQRPWLHSCLIEPFYFNIEQKVLHEEIAQSYLMAALPGPHAFLFVLNPTTRITEEELKMLNSVREIFGTASINHTIIIFTHSDSLDADGTTIQEYLAHFKSNHPLNKLLDQCGHHYLAVNNRATNTEKTAT